MTTTPTTFIPQATLPAPFHLVAPVTVRDGELFADLDESKVSSSMTAAVDRMKAGLRAGEVFAVWDFKQRPNPVVAAEVALGARPARLLVHVGGGELLQLAEEYRIALEIKEN
jgi:hypothetical protein